MGGWSTSRLWAFALLMVAPSHGIVAGAYWNNSQPSGLITSDSYFFGMSPPVYPSPNGTGTGDWALAYKKATGFIDQLTLDEKISLTAGVGSDTSCVGTVAAINRLGFPGMCVQDAGNGVRGEELVSAWPGGISTAASFNKTLANMRGKGMGGEYMKKGVNSMLGPVVGPIGRIVKGGRVWEGFGADPYSAGVLAYETIHGVHSAGVATTIKHFIGNEQETTRNPRGNFSAISSNIDDKTMHEVYLWPFADALKAGTPSVMCSYQRINNSYGCQNSKTLNGLLKEELGFQGYVVTDWQAIHGGVASAQAGLDLAMPNDQGFWGGQLKTAVQNGTVPESRITDMATRIIAAWYKLGQDKTLPDPGFAMVADKSSPHKAVDARDPAYKGILYSGALESHVLLKNDGVLPLKKPKIMSVFGPSARAQDSNSFNGIWSLGYAAYDLNGVIYETNGPVDPSKFRPLAVNGTLFTGGGSGATSQSTVSAPLDALINQAWQDDTALYWDLTNDAPTVNAASDVCLVLTNLYGSEDFDRPALDSDYSNTLINNVANTCENIVVIIHNPGVATVNPSWYNHPNVKALIFGHYPGQYSGKALVDLLYGRENFSGKLPYTVAKNESDYGPLLNPDLPEGDFYYWPQSNFTEGALIDYRRFDYNDIQPQFEFGFGLSYTKFTYESLRLATHILNKQATYPKGPIQEGGAVDLWDELVTITATVHNTGSVDGAEAAQLYLKVPGAGKNGNPVKTLRGFDKQHIKARGKATFSFTLTRRDLSVWDVTHQQWKLQRGSYGVMVGSSSRQLPLEVSFSI